MPRMQVTNDRLADDRLDPKGEYLVVELLNDHHQLDLAVVPKGTRCIATRGSGGCSVCVIPFEVLPSEMRVFSDGHVRVVPTTAYRALGRVTLKK